MHAGDARIADHEVGFGHTPDLQGQLGHAKAAVGVQPGQFDPAHAHVLGRYEGMQVGGQGQELGEHFRLPFNAKHFTGLRAAFDPDGPQAAAAHRGAGAEFAHHVVRRQNLFCTRQIAQTRSEVDGITEAVAIDHHDLASRHADLHHEFEAVGPLNHALGVFLLDLDHGLHRQTVAGKRQQDTVAQHLHDHAAVFHARGADPLGELGHHHRGAVVTQCFKHRNAPRQIHERNCQFSHRAKEYRLD
ncbi:hypothetical protein FQZ97_851850 [compost metagenome]